MIDKPRKQIYLGAHFPGVDNGQIEFDSFVHFARTAERGLFDFFLVFFLDDLDAVGRLDTFTILVRSRPSPTDSAWPGPSARPSTNPSKWHGNSPPWTTSPTAGPPGTW